MFGGMNAANAQVTSKNNAQLRKALKQFPAADANSDGVLTMQEGLAFRQRQKSKRNAAPAAKIPLTHADIAYGPHRKNVLDLWLAETDAPTPLLICIHGGGFSGGDKRTFHNSPLVPAMLDHGISVATMNYRLTEGGKNPYPAAMHDAARGVQFLRHHADRFNLDPARFAATGGSAGGTITLWLGFHDDLANPDSDDPVLRQSTRLTACAPSAAQPSLHLPTLLGWFGVEKLAEHGGGRPLFGIPPDAPLEMTPRVDRLSRDASPITHLTPDDPPVFFTAGRYRTVNESMSPNVWVHHPIMGIQLGKAMDVAGVPCFVSYEGGPAVTEFDNAADFIIQQLTTGS